MLFFRSSYKRRHFVAPGPDSRKHGSIVRNNGPDKPQTVPSGRHLPPKGSDSRPAVQPRGWKFGQSTQRRTHKNRFVRKRDMFAQRRVLFYVNKSV